MPSGGSMSCSHSCNKATLGNYLIFQTKKVLLVQQVENKLGITWISNLVQ
jgi:hypothetical protein